MFGFGTRDVVWSVVVFFAATWFVQCRPAWSARRFVEREADAGFDQAYTGYRHLSGGVIGTPGQGAVVDPMAPMVTLRRFEVTAGRVSWSGRRAEFVVKYWVELHGEEGASRDVHVQLAKRNGAWEYTLFEVRGTGPIAEPNFGNPWARALRPR